MRYARPARPPLVLLIVIGALLALLAPATALADDPLPHDDSVLFLVNAGVDVPAGEHRDVVVVVDGDVAIEGEANAVVVVSGTATVTGGRVETLVVVGGAADIGAGSVVDEVRTLNAAYHVSPDAFVRTYEAVEPSALLATIAPVAMAMWLGFAIAYLLAGLAVAAIAGSQLRRTGAALTREPLGVVVGALVVLIGLPLVLAVSVVGIPAAVAVALVVVPAAWFFGSLAVAVRIGDWVLVQLRGRPEASHPVIAAFIGLVAVGVVSAVPVIGFLVGLAGAGAAVLVAWRAATARALPSPSRPIPQPGPVGA